MVTSCVFYDIQMANVHFQDIEDVWSSKRKCLHWSDILNLINKHGNSVTVLFQAPRMNHRTVDYSVSNLNIS